MREKKRMMKKNWKKHGARRHKPPHTRSLQASSQSTNIGADPSGGSDGALPPIAHRLPSAFASATLGRVPWWRAWETTRARCVGPPLLLSCSSSLELEGPRALRSHACALDGFRALDIHQPGLQAVGVSAWPSDCGRISLAIGQWAYQPGHQAVAYQPGHQAVGGVHAPSPFV